MKYQIEFTKGAKKDIAKYKKSNPTLFKKLTVLLLELMEHPRSGTGHPEPLKNGDSRTYSRRITAQHRIIYDIYDDTITVLVIEVGGHYNDK